MGSQVLEAGAAGALDRVGAGIDELWAAGIEPVDGVDALAMVREVEVLARRLRAVQVELVDVIDRRGLHRLDGHASAKVMVRHAANLADGEAARRAAGARTLRDLPEVRSAFRAGRIGSCHLDRIARAHRERLCGEDAALARLASRSPYRSFDATLTDWVRRVDQDGTCDRAQQSHENRDAKIVQDFDGSWSLTAGCGSLQGAELRSVFRRFLAAEVATDWEKARLEHGPDATVDHLARTDGQRRFDALFEIFQRAAAARAGAPGGSHITTDIVIDQATFERELRRLAGARCDPVDLRLDPTGGPGDAGDAGGASTMGAPSGSGGGRGGFRCSTLDGNPVDVTEAVAARRWSVTSAGW